VGLIAPLINLQRPDQVFHDLPALVKTLQSAAAEGIH
jgi:hypothetical protein